MVLLSRDKMALTIDCLFRIRKCRIFMVAHFFYLIWYFLFKKTFCFLSSLELSLWNNSRLKYLLLAQISVLIAIICLFILLPLNFTLIASLLNRRIGQI